jgi:phosphohistidine phosphatase
MVRRLLLIRHAKTETGHRDLTRRLTERGRRDAHEIGRWLMVHELSPDAAVVSPATRAMQTWELAAQRLVGPVPMSVHDGIYRNTVDDVLEAIASTEESVQTLAVIGHNPSMAALTQGWNPDTGDFRTGSVAVFGVESTWSNIGESAVSLTMFATCRG